MMLRLYLLSGLTLSLIFGAIELAAEESNTGGRELYMTYQCWQCHGYEGQGGPDPRIASKGYPFDAFVRFVRYPNLMPAYTSKLLSDAELRSIYEYVLSIPAPPALEDIPALRDK